MYFNCSIQKDYRSIQTQVSYRNAVTFLSSPKGSSSQRNLTKSLPKDFQKESSALTPTFKNTCLIFDSKVYLCKGNRNKISNNLHNNDGLE